MVERIRGREEKKIGIGWVLVDEINKNSNISFKCRIADWPSSTRTELGRFGQPF